jgi:hypothetical protein
MEQDDLSARLGDRAVFLPAISSFYSNYVGSQRYSEAVELDRIPKGFERGIEGMNWLNQQEAYFYYPWSLYSAGHANLDLNKFDAGEDMVRNRDRSKTVLLGDSGGFQIATAVWAGEWRDPNSQAVQDTMADCEARGFEDKIVKKKKRVVQQTATGVEVVEEITEKTVKVDLVKQYRQRLAAAQTKRETVLKWLDGIADYAMVLDIPIWIQHNPVAAAASGITNYEEAVAATKYNNEYFMANRLGVKNGGAKFLNVLQASDHETGDAWYEEMKDYCDPKKYPDRHFDGWAMGGQNMCEIELVLKRLVTICHDGLMQPGVHDWIHVLGTSRLEWGLVLTDIQRAIRRYFNPQLTISFDCASPFLATAKGQIYYESVYPDGGKWSYKMSKAVDDKKYAKDLRSFDLVMTQDGHFDTFTSTPISRRLGVSDVCYYQPGMLNKIMKEGKTSWDSFSYALQMGHNVYMHIDSVLKSNELYDSGIAPNMLVHTQYDTIKFRDVVDSVFSAPTLDEALELVKEHSRGFWYVIKGTRGDTGRKAIKPQTNTFFTGLPKNEIEDE